MSGRKGRRRSNANVQYTQETNPFSEQNRPEPVDVPGDDAFSNLESDGIPSIDALDGPSAGGRRARGRGGPPTEMGNDGNSDPAAGGAQAAAAAAVAAVAAAQAAAQAAEQAKQQDGTDAASNASTAGSDSDVAGDGTARGGSGTQFVPPRRGRRGRGRGGDGDDDAGGTGAGTGAGSMEDARAAAMAAVAAVAANPHAVVDTVVEEVNTIRLARRRRSQTIEPGSQSEAPILVKDGVVYTPSEFVQSTLEDNAAAAAAGDSSNPPRPDFSKMSDLDQEGVEGGPGEGSDGDKKEYKVYPDNVVNGVRIGHVTALRQAGEGSDDESEDMSSSDSDIAAMTPQVTKPPEGPIDLEHVLSALQLANPVLFEFDYAEQDTFGSEINEFFTFHEVAYEIPSHTAQAQPLHWEKASVSERQDFIELTLERLEHVRSDVRRSAACNLFHTLYATHLANSEERLTILKQASTALVETGIALSNLTRAISIILNSPKNTSESESNTSDFRLFFNVMYPLLLLNRYSVELKHQILHPVTGDICPLRFVFDLLMESNTNTGDIFTFPIKKLLLCGWKMLIVVTGGLEALDADKPPKPYQCETPVPRPAPAYSKMRPSSPPFHVGDRVDTPRDQDAGPIAGKNAVVDDDNDDDDDDDDDDARSVASTVSGLSTISTSSLKAHPKDIAWHKEFMHRYLRRDGGVPRHVEESHRMIEMLVHHPAADLRGKIEDRYSMADPPGGELVYRALLPHLCRYVIVMLKTLLAASPTVKNYTGSVVIDSTTPIYPEAARNLSVNEIDFDLKRHKEIVIKAISAILLLLLKHFRNSAVFQSDFLGLYLTDTNCILLILKFVNQDLAQYFCRDYEVSDLCLLPDVDRYRATATVPETYIIQASWRDILTTVNLIRVLQKLTKTKPTRVKTMITFKAQVIIRRLLKAETPVLQFYALKLLKSQARFLGKKWVNANMKVVTKIYNHVRPSLHDPWLNCDPASLPDDRVSQSELAQHRIDLEQANLKHYGDILSAEGDDRSPAFPKDVDPHAVPEEVMYGAEATYERLMKEVQLDEDFRNNYEEWLEREVFSVSG